jgi:hypothetical protein
MVFALRSGMNPRLLLLLPMVVLTACGLIDGDDMDCNNIQCSPCPPALTLRLHFPAGQPRAEAVLEGIQGACAADGTLTVCSISPNQAGTYEFDVKATGYQRAHVSKTVPEATREGCCSCGYVSQVVDLNLTPE